MKKYKLLYFVSEDEYFLTHKIFQAKDALKNFDILVVSRFSNYEENIKSHGFKTQNINFDRKSLNLFTNLNFIYQFIKTSYKFRPDIIQCIALKPILVAIISSFFLKKKVKIISCVVGLGFLFINKNPLTYTIRFIYFSLLKIFLNRNTTFIFQNNEDEKIFRKYGVLKFNSSKIIYGSGVNIKKFKASKVKKVYDLIFHSRILKDKGICELIKAIKFLKKKNVLLKTLILGDPDFKNFATITKNELEIWNEQKLIIWKPKVKNVLPYIQKSKISILPSYREGLPKSLLEAASCELPIITTDVPGCKEVCKHNFNGYLVKSKDHHSLAESIEKLTKNNNLIRKFGHNSRALVSTKFADTIVVKEFNEIYEKILK